MYATIEGNRFTTVDESVFFLCDIIRVEFLDNNWDIFFMFVSAISFSGLPGDIPFQTEPH